MVIITAFHYCIMVIFLMSDSGNSFPPQDSASIPSMYEENYLDGFLCGRFIGFNINMLLKQFMVLGGH